MDDYFDLNAAIAIHSRNNPTAKPQGVGFYLAALTENSDPYNPDKHNSKHGGFREYPKCVRITGRDESGKDVVLFDDVVNSRDHEALIRQKYEQKPAAQAEAPVPAPEYIEQEEASEAADTPAEAPRRGRRPIPRGE